MVDIDVGAFVEAVVRGSRGGRTEVVVDVGEAMQQLVGGCTREKTSKRYTVKYIMKRNTYSVKSDTSPCCGGILSKKSRLSRGVAEGWDDKSPQAAPGGDEAVILAVKGSTWAAGQQCDQTVSRPHQQPALGVEASISVFEAPGQQ